MEISGVKLKALNKVIEDYITKELILQGNKIELEEDLVCISDII